MFLFIFCIIFAIISNTINGTEKLEEYTVQEIPKLIEKSCLFLATSSNISEAVSILRNLSKVFSNDSGVKIGVLRPEQAYFIKQEDILPSTIAATSQNVNNLVFYPKKVVDRKCLLKPPRERLKVEQYTGPVDAKAILHYLNQRCGTFRDIQGSLTHDGRMREYILGNLYSVNAESERKSWNRDGGPVNIGAECERISMPSKDEFIYKYLYRSKPVIITGKTG